MWKLIFQATAPVLIIYPIYSLGTIVYCNCEFDIFFGTIR